MTQKSSYCQNLVLFVVAANTLLVLILSIFNARLVPEKSNYFSRQFGVFLHSRLGWQVCILRGTEDVIKHDIYFF